MINDVFCFCGKDADAYGVNAAVILYNLKFWVKVNKANEKNFFDGHYWTYNSVKAFREIFHFFSNRQIELALKTLEDMGAIKSGNYHEDRRRRDKWYTIALQDIECNESTENAVAFHENVKCNSRSSEMDFTKTRNPPYTDINTDINTDNNKLGVVRPRAKGPKPEHPVIEAFAHLDPKILDFMKKISPNVQDNIIKMYPDTVWLTVEFYKMLNWIDQNPQKCHSRSRWGQFASSWLDRNWQGYLKNMPSKNGKGPKLTAADLPD